MAGKALSSETLLQTIVKTILATKIHSRALPGLGIELSHARVENRLVKLHLPVALSPRLPAIFALCKQYFQKLATFVSLNS
jgi:hypothetical protein